MYAYLLYVYLHKYAFVCIHIDHNSNLGSYYYFNLGGKASYNLIVQGHTVRDCQNYL